MHAHRLFSLKVKKMHHGIAMPSLNASGLSDKVLKTFSCPCFQASGNPVSYLCRLLNILYRPQCQIPEVLTRLAPKAPETLFSGSFERQFSSSLLFTSDLYRNQDKHYSIRTKWLKSGLSWSIRTKYFLSGQAPPNQDCPDQIRTCTNPSRQSVKCKRR